MNVEEEEGEGEEEEEEREGEEEIRKANGGGRNMTISFITLSSGENRPRQP